MSCTLAEGRFGVHSPIPEFHEVRTGLNICAVRLSEEIFWCTETEIQCWRCDLISRKYSCVWHIICHVLFLLSSECEFLLTSRQCILVHETQDLKQASCPAYDGWRARGPRPSRVCSRFVRAFEEYLFQRVSQRDQLPELR